GASHDHASDGQGSDALRGRAAMPALLGQTPLQDAYHRLEHGLESAPRTGAATRDIGRQRNHGTRVLNVLVVLARQIGSDNLCTHVGRRQIDVHTLPAVFPIGVGEEAAQHLDIEVALAFEVAVKPAVRQPHAGHNLVQGDIFESVAIEKLARAVDDVFLYCCAMTIRVRHEASVLPWAPQYASKRGRTARKILS